MSFKVGNSTSQALGAPAIPGYPPQPGAQGLVGQAPLLDLIIGSIDSEIERLYGAFTSLREINDRLGTDSNIAPAQAAIPAGVSADTTLGRLHSVAARLNGVITSIQVEISRLRTL